MGNEERDSAGEQSSSPAVPNDRQADAGDDSSHSSQTDQPGVLGALAKQEGWSVEGEAARVHYSGATDRYSIEYYHPSECVLYWKVPPEDVGNTAVPVGRNTVPTPLRERIREDLQAAGVDPAIEHHQL